MKHAAVEKFFADRAWTPFPFQRRVWNAFAGGSSGLLHAPTGTGKTLAVWFAGVSEALSRSNDAVATPGRARRKAGSETPIAATSPGYRVLWLTPMRALAADTHKSLVESAQAVGLPWKIELRTGDTSAHAKVRQRTRPPQALVTTPESLSVMLTYPETAAHLAGLSLLVVDEWHELLGSKRGVQTELVLAALRAAAPSARTWGISATLGNVQHAMEVLLGPLGAPSGVLVRGAADKQYDFSTLIPDQIERFPWAGHLGIRMLSAVLEQIERVQSTLLFTNTRSQTEIWFQSILRARPDWLGTVALHHGSLDRALRGKVEGHIKAGRTRCVVCTSSLDLGVDFEPVDQVIQVGSPKGVGRLLQRAGRSGHQPGRPSRVVCVPTNALELVEFAAARDAVAAGAVEARRGLVLSMDVLCQHILTMAVGAGPGGLDPAALAAQVRTTHAFASLTDQQWHWALDFAVRGGPSLAAYARFARLVPHAENPARFRVAAVPVARQHRMGIGTIVSETAMVIRTLRGKSLGSVEEGFIARLKPGDVFVFSGRRLELIRVHQMTAFVRPVTKGRSGAVPAWAGARMPLSHELAEAVKVRLAQADSGELLGPEMAAAGPVLQLQRCWSRLPRPGELVIETCRTREGYHAYLYPLAGRLVHEGLAALAAYRISLTGPTSLSMACNDYGFELLCTSPMDFTEQQWRSLLSAEGLATDLLACVNAAELARRQFREIARIAGLIVPGFPGAQRSTRQVQASSELYFDVFREFDSENLLLDQAQRQVLENQLEIDRLAQVLREIHRTRLVLVPTEHLTPFAFPLWADRLREQVSSEQWQTRVKRMLESLEAQAAAVPPALVVSTPRRRRRPGAPAVAGTLPVCTPLSTRR